MAGILFHVADSTPAESGGIDEHTKLMLHMDGDQSDSQHTVTHNGDPQFSTVESQFGGSSMYFDGTGDYLTIPDSDDFHIGDNYTIEFCIYFNTLVGGTAYYIIAHRIGGAATDGWGMFYLSDVGMRFWEMNSGLWTLDSATGWTTGIWYHVAVVKNGSDVKMYRDGIEVASGTNASFIEPTQDFFIGQGGGNDYYLNAHMQEFRLSDTARWTSAFTPELEPYENDANTLLLMHMVGDDSDSAHDVQLVGNHVLTPVTAKFDGAMHFDGTGDYLSVPDSPNWAFGTGDFTIDFWFNAQVMSNNNNYAIISQGDATGYNMHDIWLHKDGSGNTHLLWREAVGGSNQWIVDIAATYNTGTWYHLACVRYGNDFRIYLNGTSVGNITYASALTDFTYELKIGRFGYDPAPQYFHGYLDEIRISKGIARWTSNFTPETGPYTI